MFCLLSSASLVLWLETWLYMLMYMAGVMIALSSIMAMG